MFREFPFMGLLLLFLLTPPIQAEGRKLAAEEPTKEEKSEENKEPAREIKPAVPTVVNLTLHPAKLPCPTRKYRLTTPYLDQTPGNAACLYYRAAVILNYEQGLARNARNDPKTGVVNLRTQRDTIEKGLKTDLADLPRDAIKATLTLYRHSFHQMEMASRRTVCDWGYPLRESDSITGIWLVELDATQRVAEALLLRARMEMADGDVQKSIDTLRTVLATAIHVGGSPFLVNKGCGRSVVRKVADQCETLVQVPNVPNLYWTFTTLPRYTTSCGTVCYNGLTFPIGNRARVLQRRRKYSKPLWKTIRCCSYSWRQRRCSAEMIGCGTGRPKPNVAWPRFA